MKQKEAVKAAITSVLGEFNSESSVSSLLTKSVRASITNKLVEQFQNGEIDQKPSFAAKVANNLPALRAYVSGLISNWVRKDSNLNGGVAYTPKSPGSRKGQGDPQLKALRALHSQATTDGDREEIQGYIDARVEEIATSKNSHKVVDYSALPPELAAKLNL